MFDVDRRQFFLASAGLTLTGIVPRGSSTPAPEAAAVTDVTRRLAKYVVSAKAADVPAPVRKEAARTVLNWMGAALGGCRHETVDHAIAALAPFSGPAQAGILDLNGDKRPDIIITGEDGSLVMVSVFTIGSLLVGPVVVRREERGLEARFGDVYREFRRTTPRWFGMARR